ncbi:benzoate 4-monooxygenase cytochrome P450 [Trichoderma austrokoningii]
MLEDLLRLWVAGAALGTYITVRTIYRLYFHPLAHIPGPKLAACSHLYEFYYNVLLSGQYLFEMERMHQKYGPIIRINPREVHISDPAFYDEIYASSSRKREKDPKFVATYALPGSMISSITHEAHHLRRGILKDFFSRRSVLELSDFINERIQALMTRLDEFRVAQSTVSIDDAVAALTSDVITSYCCGKHWGFIENAGFRNDIRKATADAASFTHITRFFPWIVTLSTNLSPRTLAIIMPGKAGLFEFLESFLEYARKGTLTGKRRSMLATLADPSIPPQERTFHRQRDEAFGIIGAGTETTATVLTVAFYHLARNPAIRDKLQAELKQLMPTPDSTPTWIELERLPYLDAFICESLRVGSPVIGRFTRVAPTETLTYKNYAIPPGTPMSSAGYFIHKDPTLFPDPSAFRPERWIEAAERGQNLKKHIVAFSKGSRNCIGINLAHMELFLTVAAFARRFNMELVDTTEDDVRVVRDFFIGFTAKGHIKVNGKLTLVDE